MQILLKGTDIVGLKNIKRVVHDAVLLAYQLLLETVFLLDQRAMFFTLPCDEVPNPLLTGLSSSGFRSDANVSCPEKCNVDSSGTIDIPISNGFHEGSAEMGLEGDTLCYEQCNPLTYSSSSSTSASLRGACTDSFSHFPSSYQSVSTYFGEVPDNQIKVGDEFSSPPKSNDHSDGEAKSNSDEEMAPSNDGILVHVEGPSDVQNSGGQCEGQEQVKDDNSVMIDPDSILVLSSRKNTSTGTVCDKSHFSRIRFYQNFDVSLGYFLRNKLLNQVYTNSTC